MHERLQNEDGTEVTKAKANVRVVRAPTGPELSCGSWQTEAAFRMIQNNLDPDVAEDPQELVVYGGKGRAARSWEDFDRILEVARTGIAILMVEQNARQALEIADRGFVLVNGENRHTDTGKALLANPEVRRSFLGG